MIPPRVFATPGELADLAERLGRRLDDARAACEALAGRVDALERRLADVEARGRER